MTDDKLFNDSPYVVHVDRPFTCVSCEEVVEPDDSSYDDRRFTKDGEEICWGCYENSFNYASTANVIREGVAKRWTITDYTIEDEYGEEPWRDEDLEFSRDWKSSGGYRGHYETSIKGWVEVPGLTGWTTGWVDETVTRKDVFNEWAEKMISGENDEEALICPVPVAIVCDPTSNVFSTAIGVWVPEEALEDFKEWLNGDLEDLSYGLS
jgi:hypothetical protein